MDRQRAKRILAWGVHLYTAMGLVMAAGMAALILRGTDEAFRGALALMIAATLIDSTDGWLARRVRVREVIPRFDGRRLDDLVDFQTYTALPLMLIWRAEVLPGAEACWLLAPLLASAYGFSQVDAKTDDGFFLGFPSYWNVVALYLYLLQPPIRLSLAIILGLSLLTFAPWRYLYPSQRTPFSLLTNLLAGVWAIFLLIILGRRRGDAGWLVILSLWFPLYYLLMSWLLTWLRWRRSGPGTDVKGAHETSSHHSSI